MKKKVILKITDMHCTSCAINIDGELEDTAGVVEAKTSYARQVTEVTFDPTQISQEKILAIIKDVGYTASTV